MRFIKGVSITLVAKVILLCFGIISSIIIARYIGPSGKGILTVLVAISGIALQFGNLGMPAANIYFMGKEKKLFPEITAISFFFSIGGGLIVAFIVYLLFILYPNIIGKVSPFFLIVTLISIPFSLITTLYTNILLGGQRIYEYNLIGILGGSFSLIVNIIFLVLLKKGILELVIMSTVINIILSLICIIYVYRPVKFKISIDLSVFSRMIKYGIKSYVACLLGYLIIRSDILFVNYILGVSSTGIYSIAVGIADLLYIIPSTIGVILFPKISAIQDQDNKGLLTLTVCRYTVFIMIILCVLIGTISKPLILLMYGAQFHSSIVPFLWLLPGIFSLGICTILMQELAGRGLPPIVYIAPAIALIVNVILNIKLIPVIHVSGAAIASSISYTIMLGLTLKYFLKITDSSLTDVLVIKRKDFGVLKEVIIKGLLIK